MARALSAIAGSDSDRLGHRTIVAGMDECGGGEADEVEPVDRRALAVELGEVAEHAAADPGAGEGGAGGVEHGLGRRRPAARRCPAACTSGRTRARAARPGTGSRVSATVRAERRDLRLEAVDVGDHRFEPRRGADGPRDVDLGGEACPVVAAARVEVADQVVGADWPRPRRRRRRPRRCRRDRGRGRARGTLPSPPGPISTRTPARAPRWRGTAPVTVRVTACSTLCPGRERVGPGQGERADVGLVRGVGPVALVLHLVGVALHPAGHAQRPGRRPWVSCAQVHHRLHRVDDLGEAALDRAAVDMLDLHRLARPRPRWGAGRRSRCGWSRSRSPPCPGRRSSGGRRPRPRSRPRRRKACAASAVPRPVADGEAAGRLRRPRDRRSRGCRCPSCGRGR